MKKVHLAVLLCAVAAGCNGGSRATVVGLVTTTNGVGGGVTVSAGEASTTADSRGRFQLEVSGSKTTVLSFTHPGHAPAYLAVKPSGKGLVTVYATLVKTTTTAVIDVRQAPATVQASGLELTFPAGSIQTASGKVPDGPVEVAVAWLPRGQAQTSGPVPLMGTDGNQTHPLISMGMFDVTLSFHGEPCQLASGKTMTATLPAGPEDPATAGLFSVDPSRAIWVREGQATRNGDRWTAEIPHLSWWNVDLFYKVPTDRCACVRFVARSPNGTGIPGVVIRSGPTAQYTFAGWTDSDGTLCHPCFPTGELVQVVWTVFLGADAEEAVSGLFDVVPSATGVKCGEPGCQEVSIPVQCTTDAHCDPGQTCQAGACAGSSTKPPPPGGVVGSCVVSGIDICNQFNGSAITEAQAQQVCNQQAASAPFKPGEPCPTANLVGSCTYEPGKPGESATYYYRPTFDGALDMLRSTCEQGGGNWQ